MHAAAQFYSSGSKITKIAVVAAVHVGLIAGLMNSKTLVAALPTLKPLVLLTPAEPVVPPEILDPPALTKSDTLPPITVPVPIIDIMDPPAPVIASTHGDTVVKTGPSTTAGTSEATAGGTGPVAVAETKPERVYNAALANADACALPSYPARSIREGNTGTVTLALLIGPNGKVSASRVQRSSGHPELDRAAVSALQMCTFKPATTNGVAESAWGKIEYVWTLD